MNRIPAALVTLVLLAGCGDCGGEDPAVDVNNRADIGFRPEQDAGGGPCTGCLDRDGNCLSGDDDEACGEGGSACRSCDDPGTACLDDGVCAAPPTCTSETCDGCCDANDECVDGGTVDQCGASGSGCAECPEGASCSDGACILGCGSDNCDGCCNAAGECVTTTSDTECGAGGGACADCTAAGGTCGGEACVSTSCAESCAGCCENEFCVDPPTAAQCGMGGAACTTCVGSQTCTAGVCETPASANWNVVMLSADIAPTKPNGSGWDFFTSLPEVFVRAATPDGMGDYVVGQSATIPETLTPIWNETILAGVTTEALQTVLAFYMLDEDDSFDDDICYVELTVDPMAMSGQIIETICPQDDRTKFRWRVEPE